MTSRLANQPTANEDERIHIVVNGEFYDFERQRRELERRGHLFRTRSDSEIALHLYEEFGAHCVQQLRGEFAFVLWDEANQSLFAARDRFGIKPLYYAVHDNTLYLASEIKALFAAGVPARWDHEYFYRHVTGPAMSDRTLFDGVHQVLPGHNLLGDRMEMAHSVEGRVPFLDHRVVECVCRAPVSLKIRGVTEKYMLREAAKSLITETVYHRQKHPFLSPPVTTVPTERFHQMM